MIYETFTEFILNLILTDDVVASITSIHTLTDPKQESCITEFHMGVRPGDSQEEVAGGDKSLGTIVFWDCVSMKKALLLSGLAGISFT